MQPFIRIRSAVLSAAVGTLVAGVAYAQTNPSSKPNDQAGSQAGMQVQSPYWNGGMPVAGGYGNTFYIQQPEYGEGLLEKTVLAVPGARADAVAAKWQYRRANSTLNSAADVLRHDFYDSDEYTNAMNDLKKAYRDLENARLDALKGLRTTAEYEAIESMRKNVNAQIADERDQDHPSLERLVALAELKMQSVAPVRAAERDMIENSQAVRDAKSRLVDAANKLAKLEKEFAHQVRDSIDLADARKAKEDARIAMLASSAFLEEARFARRIAVTYSFASRGLSVPGYNSYGYFNSPMGYGGYSGYGYGYGYGYGSYWGGVEYGQRTGVVSGGVTGNTPIGAGTNAFFGRGGNAIMGPGPGHAETHPTPPGANSPGQPFGPNPGRDIPPAFGTEPIPGAFGTGANK